MYIYVCNPRTPATGTPAAYFACFLNPAHFVAVCREITLVINARSSVHLRLRSTVSQEERKQSVSKQSRVCIEIDRNLTGHFI